MEIVEPELVEIEKRMQVPILSLPSWAIFIVINFEYGVLSTAVTKLYGEKCISDHECLTGDHNLLCFKTDVQICKCRRGYVWDLERKKCLPTIDDDMYNGNFDPVRDLIIPGLIIMTIGAMVYLGIKLFCNCGKLWRRRRRQEIARELEELRTGSHQQAWITSYRVFSPYGTSNRPPSALPTRSFSLDPTTCMSLFLSSQSLPQSPPPYEEALKHKVIMSSYHPPGNPVVPIPVSAYTIPTLDVPRRYQTLPRNPSTVSSSFIVNSNSSNAPSLKVRGQRPFPVAISDTYGGMSVSNEWSHLQYPGTTGQVWEPCTSSPVSCRIQEPSHSSRESPEATAQPSRVPPVDVWTPNNRNPHVPSSHPRSGVHRPGQAQKIYHGNSTSVHLRSSNRNS